MGLLLAIQTGFAPSALAQTVRGRVLDASTGEGIGAAEIRLTSETRDTTFRGLTNEIGTFVIEVDASGPYDSVSTISATIPPAPAWCWSTRS